MRFIGQAARLFGRASFGTESFDVRRHSSRLPSLVHNFNHALIARVTIGPRREATLIVSPLAWNGQSGQYTEPVVVRFGGIKNFDEVSRFFGTNPPEQLELAWLRYREQPRSKPGSLYIELELERTNSRLVVQCSNLQVGGPAQRR